MSATLTVAVPAAQVFAVLADPTTHSAIDGTGWVQEAVDLKFPPFGLEHLTNSLQHLAELAAPTSRASADYSVWWC
ncbi:MAG: hypothetical protein ACRDRJ_43200 [Streptosporangiaceae bacterium]